MTTPPPSRRRPAVAPAGRGTITGPSRTRTAVLVLLAVLLAGCSGIVTLSTGDPVELVRQPQTSRVLAADGSVVAELRGLEDRREVALDDVADVLVQAVVAIEDRRFFTHAGVDLPAIVRALAANVESGQIEQGGSTITQQYVKNTITGNAVTLERKVEEAVLAWELEQQLDKREILERYLNTVYFGGGAYGVAAAAEAFFGVSPDRLELDQAALLAGLVRSPSALDPRREPDAALARRELVLDAMVDVGVVTVAEADAARGAALELVPPPAAGERDGGWFVDEVRRTIAGDDRFAVLGNTPDERTDALLTGGLRITTTLDPRVQRLAEDAVTQVLPEQDDPQAAVVVLEPATGAVRALVGGRTDDGIVGGFSTATRARRQPGSAFKPVVLAAALERGTSLDRVFDGGACRVFDGVPDWQDPPGVCNYAGTSYGPMTLREATVRSVNTTYAELGVELGPTAMLAQARQLGIGGDLPEVHALALGAGEVTPFDLAAAYAPFATLGIRHPVHLVTRVEDADGRLLYAHDEDPYRVLDEGVAHFVTTTLAEVVERGTGVRAAIDRPQAGKTGTSQDSADAWFVGYTPDLLAAVWVGFDEGRVPMVPPRTREVVEGGRWPAEVWAALMAPALASEPATAFTQPSSGVQVVEVDVTRNCLPNPYTPDELVEAREYPPGAAPTERCTEPTGPPVDDVPSLVGLPLETALSVLAEQGFAFEVRAVEARLYPTGIVERQRPDPGGATLEQDGNAVVVWIATNTGARVVVPDVRGLPGGDAVAALESAGFVVDLAPATCPDPDAAPPDAPGDDGGDLATDPGAPPEPDPCAGGPGSVAGSDPAPGERVREHAVITLQVVPG